MVEPWCATVSGSRQVSLIPPMGAGTPLLHRWSWDGADRLLMAKIRP